MYPAGIGFIMTPDLCAHIARSAELDVFDVGFPEDAVVGAWLAGTMAKYVNASDRIHDLPAPEFAYRPCSSRDLIVHLLHTAEDWQRIDESGRIEC